MSEAKTCAHCGRLCGDYEGGYAGVPDERGRVRQVCHPNVIGRPDCYRLVTVYHEKLGSRLPKREAG